MTIQQNAATGDLVDLVAEAITGQPLHDPTADVWRTSARKAIAAIEDWLMARSNEQREAADHTRRAMPGERGRSYASNQLRNANGLAGAAGLLRRNRAQQVRTCRICSCTDMRACDPPCHWVEADLCSGCTA